MQVSVDISLYPLTADYERPIIAFIKRLNDYEGLQLATNQLTTQLTGDYDTVMDSLKEAMRRTLEGETKCSFVVKILNVAIVPNRAATL